MTVHRISEGRRYAYPVYCFIELLMNCAARTAAQLRRLYGDTASLLLVCTGTSGVLIAAELVKILGGRASVYYIRKGDEAAHLTASLPPSAELLIVVDDIMASGATMRYIANKLGEHSVKVKAVCLADEEDTNHTQLLSNLFVNLNHLIL